MHLLFDTSVAAFGVGGVARHTRALATALPAVAARYGWRVSTAALPAWMHPDGRRGGLHRGRVLAWDVYYRRVLLPARARAVGATVIYSEARLPVPGGVPLVAPLYDLMPILFPQFLPWQQRVQLGYFLRHAERNTDHLLAIAHQTRHEAMRYAGVSPAHLSVAPPGVGAAFRPVPPAQQQAVLQRYGIVPPYVLAVGVNRPNKNRARIVAAMAQVWQQTDLPQRLVVVGSDAATLAPLLAGHPAAARVQAVGFVPDDAMPALYSAADLLLFPSLYEGFGLPVLEAMACGCPVVTADVAALPETAGDAAVLVNPYHSSTIAAGVQQVLCDDTHAATLRARGIARAARFTWERTADATMQGILRMLAQRGRQTGA